MSTSPQQQSGGASRLSGDESHEDRSSPPDSPQGPTSRGNSPDQTHETINEHSPLLAATGNGNRGLLDDGREESRLPDGDDSQDTKSLWYLILLTVGIGGLQIAWSVELSNGSPYLLSLGLSKSLMALVWIAGPLTGTLVQPYIGMLSDSCRMAIGKRKPFILGGSVATILSLMTLAWTKEIVGGLLGVFGADPESHGVKLTIIICAVIGIYVLDIAINTVQASVRAFIVDCAPAHQQEVANAMASRFIGIGNIVGFIAGYVDLRTTLWFFGDTQFKVLCAIASIALGATVVLSTAVIRERDPRLEGPVAQRRRNLLRFLFTISKSIRRLPPQVKRVCQVQFFAWIGFFPLLFYTSSYIGEIYLEPYLRDNPHMTPAELDKLYEKATRIGTFALLMNAVVSLLTNVFVPFLVAPTYDSRPVPTNAQGETDSAPKLGKPMPRTILDRLRIPGFTLRRAWLGSLVLFSVAMLCTLLVRSVRAATALIGIAGITWAMTLWAPWAIISAEISRRDALNRAQKLRDNETRRNAEFSLPPELDGPPGQYGASGDETDVIEDHEDQAGVILGIHNMAISAPQILATVGSSIVFKIWQKPRGTPGDHSMAIVLALGGVFVLVSSYFVLRIKESTSSLAPGMTLDAEQGGSAVGGPSSNAVPRTNHEGGTLVRNRSFGGLQVR